MQSTVWQPQIPLIANGQDVSAEVVNPIIKGFTDRTQYLYDRFNELADRSVLIIYDDPIFPDSGVDVNSVVYFLHDDLDPNVTGVALASPQLSDDGLQIRAGNSSFVYGIVKSKIGDSKADIWIQGLIEQDGILEAVIDESIENQNIVSGPLYLSNTSPGKLTFFPGGFAVYVGYAKNRDAILLNPSFEATNSLFQTFKFILLDRPAGLPVYDGQVWTIPSPDYNVVGWIPVGPSYQSWYDNEGIIVPSNEWNKQPLFFYHIPDENQIEEDDGLQPNEKLVSRLFKRSLPPSPTNFTLVARNGILQLSRQDGIVEVLPTSTTSTTTPAPWITTSDGIYHITKDGVWWYGNENDTIPWSRDLVTAGYTGPADWLTIKGPIESRVRLMVIFSRLNPDVRATMVTSLNPFKDVSNDSTKVVKYISADANQIEASTGDLLTKFTLPVNSRTTETVATGQAIKQLVYDEPNGELKAVMGSVVSDVKGMGSIQVQKDKYGVAVVSSLSTATPLMLSALEPENSRLELVNGINTCLTLDVNRLPSGFLGKIVLPNDLIPGWSVRIRMVYVGRYSAALSQDSIVPLRFSYNVMNLGYQMPNSVTSLVYNVPFPSNYVTLTSAVTPITDSQGKSLDIPASALTQAGGGIINFRMTWESASGSTTYPGNLGIVACYWYFVPPA